MFGADYHVPFPPVAEIMLPSPDVFIIRRVVKNVQLLRTKIRYESRAHYNQGYCHYISEKTLGPFSRGRINLPGGGFQIVFVEARFNHDAQEIPFG